MDNEHQALAFMIGRFSREFSIIHLLLDIEVYVGQWKKKN